MFFIDITAYAYTAYKIGDVVPYNGMEFYVIKDSSTDEDSVTMLKAEPLTYEEIKTYSEGTGAQISNKNGYGVIQYHLDNSNYSTSFIKHVIDKWASNKIQYGLYEARLLKIDEYRSLTVLETYETPTEPGEKYIPQYNWMYNNNYIYWIMDNSNDSVDIAKFVDHGGSVGSGMVNLFQFSARPVITLKKTALVDVDESIKDNNTDDILLDGKNDADKKESITKVKVENTYKGQTLIIIIIGFISICSGVVIYYLIKNKKVISRR